MRTALLVFSLALAAGCGSGEHRERPDAGPAKRRTHLPADGGLFIDPDRDTRDLGRDILRDVGRLDAHAGLAADHVVIGGAYTYGFAFEDDEVPEGHEALAIPVTITAPPRDLALGRLALVDERGRPVAAEPIVEWLDPTGTTIVAPPAQPPRDEMHLLLVYFVPRSLRAGALRYAEGTLGPVRRGARGPVRPRSRCEVLGAFGYAPIPREVLVELVVHDAFARWTPLSTTVSGRDTDAPPTRCRGFRRLDAQGALLETTASAPSDVAFLHKARFLAVYDLPEGETPGTLRWDGTDCEATDLPERAALPDRLGPELGPPRFVDTAE